LLRWIGLMSFLTGQIRKNRLRISQHAVYKAEKGAIPKVEPGFKNSDSCGGIEEFSSYIRHLEDCMEMEVKGVWFFPIVP
jgi:hypothetical protein